MSSTTPITEEQMKYLSVIATHTALIELGKLEELKTSTEKQQEKDNIEMIHFLEKYLTLVEYFEKSEKSHTTNMSFANPETFKEILNKSLEHIHKLNTIIQGDKIKYYKLQEENTELQEEHKELIKETEELEENIETKEKVNTERIEKLRNICIKRNKTIKILKYLLLNTIVHLCIISYIGFMKYYYTLVYIVIGISNKMYNVYCNLRILLVNTLYISNIVKQEFIEVLPFLYSIANISYGFYIFYYLMCVSIYRDIVNSIYTNPASYLNFVFDSSINSTLHTNNSANICYVIE